MSEMYQSVHISSYKAPNPLGLWLRKKTVSLSHALGIAKKKNPYLIYCSKGKALKHIIKDFIPFTNSQTLSVDI